VLRHTPVAGAFKMDMMAIEDAGGDDDDAPTETQRDEAVAVALGVAPASVLQQDLEAAQGQHRHHVEAKARCEGRLRRAIDLTDLLIMNGCVNCPVFPEVSKVQLRQVFTVMEEFAPRAHRPLGTRMASRRPPAAAGARGRQGAGPDLGAG
jgi:hypothetical protein